MPMYLGNARVKGMYLGSKPHKGFALGSESSTYDYGVDQYAMPVGIPSLVGWTINTGFTSPGKSSNGIWFTEGSSGGNCESPSITPVAGRKYQYVVSRPGGGYLHSDLDYAVIFIVDGVGVPASLKTVTNGNTVSYTYTALSTDPISVSVFSFESNSGDRLWLNEVYIKEVQ